LHLARETRPRTPGRIEEHVVERRFAREAETLSQLGLEPRRRPFANDPAVVDDGSRSQS
jgi:hypothetical protein